MSSEFRPQDKMLFAENYVCWNCGQNHVNCLHHIVGRGGPKADCEGSIYNAAPMNNEICHLPIHGMLMKDFTKMKLLVKTKQFLESIGYKNTTKDYLFLEKYKKLYGK